MGSRARRRRSTRVEAVLVLFSLTVLSSSSPSRKRGLDIEGQLNDKLQELNLLLPPSMHLQWLKTNDTIALIDVNPVTGTYDVLAQTRMREQMTENAAVLIRVLKRAHTSRFKKYQGKLEREKVVQGLLLLSRSKNCRPLKKEK
jgi:hypothetical protein